MSLVKLMLAKDKSKKTLKRATDLLLGGLEELKRPNGGQFGGSHTNVCLLFLSLTEH
jgi:hypothetical protein